MYTCTSYPITNANIANATLTVADQHIEEILCNNVAVSGDIWDAAVDRIAEEIVDPTINIQPNLMLSYSQ